MTRAQYKRVARKNPQLRLLAWDLLRPAERYSINGMHPQELVVRRTTVILSRSLGATDYGIHPDDLILEGL